MILWMNFGIVLNPIVIKPEEPDLGKGSNNAYQSVWYPCVNTV